MSTRTVTGSTGITTRRFGYLIAIAVDAVALWLINVVPTWTAVPFLTTETSRVVGAVNASLAVGLVVNLAFMANDRASLKALGDLVTTTASLLAMVRIWNVFPFELDGSFFGYADRVVRTVLAVAIIGTAAAAIVALVRLIRASSAPAESRPRP